LMFSKLGLLGICVASFCAANPISYIFTGMGTGTIGSTPFSDAPFSITFNSNTSSLAYGTAACADFSTMCSGPSAALSCCSNDVSTPDSTANTFIIDGITGSLTGSSTAGPAVFLNPLEENVGIWFFAEPDFMPAGNAVFGTYNLASSLAPVATQSYGNLQFAPPGPGMNSTAGTVNFSAVTNTTFQAVLSSTGSISPVPEPWMLVLVGIGLIGMAGGLRRKRSSK
jgi:hypothetical protein